MHGAKNYAARAPNIPCAAVTPLNSHQQIRYREYSQVTLMRRK
jgi:hypothetical protein